MRNLMYPLNWEEILAYVGFPGWMKPFDGGGWRDVFRIDNEEAFFRAYDGSGTTCMTYQEDIDFEEYYRCYVIGQKHVHVMPYQPRNPHHLRYQADFSPSKEMHAKITEDCLTLCQALGYDMNTVEFAVRDGIPYAIDFMNPAPDAELDSVGQENFDWVVETLATYAIELAIEGRRVPEELRWSRMLAGDMSLGTEV